MPLPVGTCADDIPTDVCCSTLYDIANRFRCVVLDALCDCFDPSCADKEFRSYVSLGPLIEDPIGDSLIVHMSRILVTTGSTTFQGSLLPVAVHQADYEIRLLEAGWPTIEMDDALENIISVPDPALVNAISKHIYSHGELMYRTVVDGLQRRTMFDDATSDVTNVQVVDFSTIQPSGELAGWSMSMRVELTFLPFVRGS